MKNIKKEIVNNALNEFVYGNMVETSGYELQNVFSIHCVMLYMMMTIDGLFEKKFNKDHRPLIIPLCRHRTPKCTRRKNPENCVSMFNL